LVDYLFILPSFDEATSYSYKWCGRLIEEVKDKVSFVDLEKNKAIRSEVERIIEIEAPKVIIHYNHGNEDRWIGQNEQPVMNLDNVGLLKDRIAYSMNCLSAKKLGVEAYKIGCTVYFGYIESFSFTTYDEQMFCEGANYGLILYTEGESNWATIKRKVFEKFSQLIDKATDPWTKLWLRNDRDALRIYAEGVDMPESDCPARQVGIRLLGLKVGWKLSRKFGLSLFLFLIGILLQAIRMGVPLLVLAFLLLIYDYLKWLKKTS